MWYKSIFTIFLVLAMILVAIKYFILTNQFMITKMVSNLLDIGRPVIKFINIFFQYSVGTGKEYNIL